MEIVARFVDDVGESFIFFDWLSIFTSLLITFHLRIISFFNDNIIENFFQSYQRGKKYFTSQEFNYMKDRYPSNW